MVRCLSVTFNYFCWCEISCNFSKNVMRQVRSKATGAWLLPAPEKSVPIRGSGEPLGTALSQQRWVSPAPGSTVFRKHVWTVHIPKGPPILSKQISKATLLGSTPKPSPHARCRVKHFTCLLSVDS